MYRVRSRQKTYDTYIKAKSSDVCEFCSIPNEHIVEHGESMLVIKNIFPYQVWDHCKVLEHFLILPKNHVNSIYKMDSGAHKEYIKLVSKYEEQGFNVYARQAANVIKSMSHHHTHLIKTDNRRRKIFFYLRKPYLLLAK